MNAPSEVQEMMDRTSISDWYATAYPSDTTMTHRMDRDVTLGGVVRCMHNGVYSYAAFFADDSIVRERMFQGIAELLACDYGAIHNVWRDCYDIDPKLFCLEFTVDTDNKAGTIHLSSPHGVIDVWEQVICGGRHGTWTEVRHRQYIGSALCIRNGFYYGPGPRGGLLKTTHWADEPVTGEWINKNIRTN